jgi:SP family general alpha glucoside:H+ symporter-like MFS transporter
MEAQVKKVGDQSSITEREFTQEVEQRRRGSKVKEVEPEDSNILHPNDDVVRRASARNRSYAYLNTEASGAANKEKEMTLKQAIKLYPKAVGWSMLLSTAIVMEGYDVILISSFYALP